MIDLVLIEDDERLASWLTSELERAGYDCRWAAEGKSGLEELRRRKPQLVLLDLNLPGRSGFDLLDEIRETNTPVIVLTARSMGSDKVRALDLGADDYLTKPFWIDELGARIRAVLRRGESRLATPVSSVLRFGKVSVDPNAREVRVDDAIVSLTKTELDLLLYLARRPGRVLMREHLYDAVLPGEESALEALQKHVSRLRAKLDDDGKSIATVRGVGYRFVGRVEHATAHAAHEGNPDG